MPATWRIFLLSALLVAGPVVFGGRGCARRAMADEVVVADDYATTQDVQGLSGEVNQLSGTVSALTGTVSDDLRYVSDDVAVLDSKVQGISETQQSQGEVLDEVLSESETISDRLGAVNTGISNQDGKLDAISEQVVSNGESIRALSESQGATEVEQIDLETLLALVPEGASAEIVQYMQYPFIWGMAAGIVGYLISLVIGAFYRLLGFR